MPPRIDLEIRPLEACRIRAGLTQMEAARRIGISKRTLREVEARKTEPRGPMLKALADVYGMDPVEVLKEIRVYRMEQQKKAA